MAGTVADQKAKCCVARATCSGFACPTGATLRNNPGNIKCPKDSATCTWSTCCTYPNTKCGGLGSNPCPNTHYWDITKANTDAGANAAARRTNCCTTNPACTGHTCTTANWVSR